MSLTTNQIQRLHKVTDYERWSLKNLAELSGDVDLDLYTVAKLKNKPPSREVTLEGGRSVYLRTSTATIGGSGVEEAIRNISPLIFASTYKCLDLFIEWLLEINGQNPPGGRWTFEKKTDRIAALISQGPSSLPQIFATDTDALECLSNLYIELEDYRHSVIHRSDFEVVNGKLVISDEAGTSHTFLKEELFCFAGSVLVSIDAIVNGTYDYVTERQLKTLLDRLSDIHGVPEFDLTRYDSEIIKCPMEPIQVEPFEWEPPIDDISKVAPVKNRDENFWLNLKGLQNGELVTEWLIPGDAAMDYLDQGFTIPADEFDEYIV
ncbi:hypothetical protein [Natrialba hulunbeirensis]|uniref:hypothetical protein n=1 Tax=Natrialba hulunbeirensis TaxID=123783 RepID=UPI0012686F4C|nr:hypothetical protein [Natrialba hulunbeirensis]